MANMRDISRYTRPRYIESPLSTEVFAGVLKTPALSIDTNNKLRLSWSNIDKLTQSYDLEYSFNNGAWELYDNPTKDKNTYDLPDNLDNGTYKFRIRAKAGITDSTFGYHEFFSPWSNETDEFTVKTLGQCSIQSIGKTTQYYFESIDSDTDYIILTITKNNSTTETVRFNKGNFPTSTTPYIINYNEVGTYVLSAVSYNNNEYLFHNSTSSNTQELQVIKLSTPVLTDENFTQENPIVNWLKITNANAYRIYLNDKVINQAYTAGVSYNFKDDISPDIENYSAKIQAIQAGQGSLPQIKYLDSEFSNEIKFGYLPTPILELNTEPGFDNQIKIKNFSQFKNADEFEIYNIVQGKPKLLITIPATESVYTMVSREPKTFNIQMKAISHDKKVVDSELSNKITYEFIRLQAPTIKIETSDNDNHALIRWEKVLNAQYYDIYINNNKKYTTDSNTYTVTLSTGNNSVYVIARSRLQKYLDSDKSNIKQIKKEALTDCLIEINGNSYPIVLPFSFTQTLDESMDTGIAVTVPISIKEPFEAYSEIVVWLTKKYYEEQINPDDELIARRINIDGFPKHMILAFDDVKEIQIGNKSLYQHNLNLIERTKLLETELMSDFSITQPMDYTIHSADPDKEELSLRDFGYRDDTKISNNPFTTETAARITTNSGYIMWYKGAATAYWAISGLKNYDIIGNPYSWYSLGSKIPLPVLKSNSFLIREKIESFWVVSINTEYFDYDSFEDFGIELRKTYKYRKHSTKYEEDPNCPETIINSGKENVWDTEGLDIGDYDLILEVDLDDENWEKTKEACHFDTDNLSGKLNFMYDSNNKPGAPTLWSSYDYDFNNLKKFRIVWGSTSDGITISKLVKPDEAQKIPWNGKNLLQALEKTIKIVKPLKYGRNSKYEIDPQLTSKLVTIPCPELKFQGGKSLYEVLTTFGRLFYGIPRLGCFDENNVYHNNWITFDILDDATIKEINKSSFEDKNNLETSKSTIENHSTGYISNLSNMITKNYYVTYPAGDLWISPRSGSDTDPLANKDNMSIILDKPIYRLVNVLVTNCSKDDPSRVIDITNFVDEENVFQSLNNNRDGKGLSIFYKQGDNKILGLGNIPQASKSQAAWGVEDDKYTIQRIIEASGIGFAKQNDVNDFRYKVTYTPYTDARIFTEQTNISGLKHRTYTNLNQEDNIIYDKSFGQSAQTQVERLGNNSIEKEFKSSVPSTLPKLGQLKEFNGYKYYADEITYIYSNNYTSCKANFSKNFNKINERVGIDAAYRLYRIYANNYINRSVNINRYCYISLDPYENVSESFKDSNYNLLNNFKNAINNGKNKCAPHIKPDAFYIRNFKNEFELLQYNDYATGELKTVPCSIVSAAMNTFNNSIMFSGKFCDNYSSGTKASKVYNKQKVQQDVRYCDTNGENPVMGITLFNMQMGNIYSDMSTASDLYPEAPYKSTPALFNNAVFSEKIDLDKDNRECINLVYQLHLQTFDKNLTIHKNLIDMIYYDKNIVDYSDIKYQQESPKYALYEGDISKQDKLQKVSATTSCVSATVDKLYNTIKIGSYTFNNVDDDYDGYALITANGKILYSYRVKIEKGKNFTVPNIYFNFSDEKVDFHDR